MEWRGLNAAMPARQEASSMEQVSAGAAELERDHGSG